MRNKIDTLTLAWATHRLSGISSPANSAYSASELEYQLKGSGAKALFTCMPLLAVALEAAGKSGIPRGRVYLLPVPKELTGGTITSSEFRTVNDLIKDGESLPKLPQLQWAEGQGARQTAFLCYSSGTSGLPVWCRNQSMVDRCNVTNISQKGVMISHRNVIANTLQIKYYEKKQRESMKAPGSQYDYTDVASGLLPQSHIYSLVMGCHATTYRGDQVINMPKFELKSFLESIQKFGINTLYLVSCNNSACSQNFHHTSQCFGRFRDS